MKIFKPIIEDLATFSGSVDISGSLTINQNLIVQGGLQGTADSASYIALENVDGFTEVSSSLEQRISGNEGSVNSLNAATSSYALQADISGALGPNATLIRSLTATGITGSFTELSASLASDINTKLNFADTGSFAKTTVNNSFTGTQEFNNINVNGTASFGFVQSVTGSATYIGSQYVVVNAQTEGARFAGIQVYDQESSLQHTASLAWDSLNNKWIYANASGSTYTGGGLISGPRNTGSIGEETFPSLNYIVRGQGGDHIYNSNIIDNDTTVKIGINTEVTGSLIVSSGITGTLTGNASTATSASYAATGPFLSSYTESDTLATVTGRGATTTSDISVNSVSTLTGGGIKLRNSANNANVAGFSRRGLWEGNTNYDPAIWAETGYGLYFYTDGSATIKASLSSAGNFYTAGTLTVGGASGTINGSTIWHAGNDGAGSGLDADTLDGVQGASYLRSDTNDTYTGTLTLVGTVDVKGGSANWNETVQGTGKGSIHIDPQNTTDNFGGAITFGASDASNGDTANAGIYVRSDGNYGTKMYFSTTDSYAQGSKTTMFLGHDGNVGIGTTSPKDILDIKGGDLAGGIAFGTKSMSISQNFANALTVSLGNHTGVYVKITAFGDWSSHSTIAYVGEFFLQNGAGSYMEPGRIIREDSNIYEDSQDNDNVVAQIVDPSGSTGDRNFTIQLKASRSNGSTPSGVPFTAYIQYEVRGQYKSIS